MRTQHLFFSMYTGIYMNTHTNTHTHIYIYIYIYICSTHMQTIPNMYHIDIWCDVMRYRIWQWPFSIPNMPWQISYPQQFPMRWTLGDLLVTRVPGDFTVLQTHKKKLKTAGIEKEWGSELSKKNSHRMLIYKIDRLSYRWWFVDDYNATISGAFVVMGLGI